MSQSSVKLQVLMPMAGQGTRVRDTRPDLPKPLIPIDGKPLFAWALSSLVDLELEIVGAIREQDAFAFAPHLSTFRELVKINHQTRGPVHSAMCANGRLRRGAPLLVLDCDLWFEAPKLLEELRNPTGDGAVCVFPSSSAHFSYVRSENDRAIEIREKEKISGDAILGAYYFRHADDFFRTAEELLSKPGEGELFVSQVIQRLVESGSTFKVTRALRHVSLGTSAELGANARHLQGAFNSTNS